MHDPLSGNGYKLSARTSPSLLVITGMTREVRLASGSGVGVMASGGDTARLRAGLTARPCGDTRLVLSFGLAGGLDPVLEPGAVVIATGVQDGAQRWLADARMSAGMAKRLRNAGVPVATADLVGVDLPILGAEAKAALWREVDAAAVDMESHVAAAYADQHAIPFLALRAVCDPAARSLPPWIGAALKPDGGTDIPAILGHIVARPSDLLQLVRLARDANAAFRSLRRCRDLLGIGRGSPDLIEFLGDIP